MESAADRYQRIRAASFSVVAAACLLLASLMSGDAWAKKTATETSRKYLVVTATAYTSHHAQTDKTPFTGAWGDRLDRQKPGVSSIAVSPDLLKLGLKRGQRVRIKGLEGEFLILDKTPARWKNRIDIYMGVNERKARRWGRRRVTISWETTR